MSRLLKSIAVGLGFALCFSALADDRVEPILLAIDRAEPGIFAEYESRPLDDERLAELRGRLAPPAQVGVVLWDEPRTGVITPVRNSSEPPGESQLNSVVIIHRR